jgi:SAM-dependent methyltransferase
MASFESVVDEYDAGRPAYPAGVYEALGPLDGLLVLEGGAGTGIATRELLARGARVVPFDVGPAVLARARRQTPDLPAVLADGARLPFRSVVADLVCFAQAWHWLDPDRRAGEAARVLRPGGRWAAWWSQARSDGERWFDEYWHEIEGACPGTHRDQRNHDWGADLDRSGFFRPTHRVVVPWVRRLSVETWLTDQRSHSYVAAMAPPERDALMHRLAGIVAARFPEGAMGVPYETWLWTAEVAPAD